jgi:hypothetical protein
MTLIGIEEHFLTAEIREAWNAIGLDAVDPSVAFHSDPSRRRVKHSRRPGPSLSALPVRPLSDRKSFTVEA